MDRYTAIVRVVGLVALVAVGFLLVFRGGGKIKINAPFKTGLKMEGTNPPDARPGRIGGEDLEAGGNVEAASKTGNDVERKRAKAVGDIKLTTESPGGDPNPKA